MLSLIKVIRSLMRRRSISSLVSPGPLVPIPPPRRDKTRPFPESLGRVYCSCANSTCNLPSLERALCAKISRINPVRSITRTPITSSMFLCCAGESSSSKMHKSTSSCRTKRASSSTLPLPIKNAGSGFCLF